MRTRTVAVSRAIILGVVLYTVTSGAGPLGRSEAGGDAKRVGIVYSDAALESNAATAVTPRVYGSATPDSVPGTYRYAITLVNYRNSSGNLELESPNLRV